MHTCQSQRLLTRLTTYFGGEWTRKVVVRLDYSVFLNFVAQILRRSYHMQPAAQIQLNPL